MAPDNPRDALLEARRRLVKQRETVLSNINNKIKGIDALLSEPDYVESSGQISFVEKSQDFEVEEYGKKQLTPLEALKEVFISNPKKRWKPSGLRDVLDQKKIDGVLDSKSKNLLHTVHSGLKSLLNQQFIDKTGHGYRKLDPSEPESSVSENEGESESSTFELDISINSPLAPTEALRKLFKEHKDKEFLIKDIFEYYEYLKGKKLLVSGSKDLRITAHQTSKSLVDQNFIQVDLKDGKKHFRKVL
jgi:hypothetical protein